MAEDKQEVLLGGYLCSPSGFRTCFCRNFGGSPCCCKNFAVHFAFSFIAVVISRWQFCCSSSFQFLHVAVSELVCRKFTPLTRPHPKHLYHISPCGASKFTIIQTDFVNTLPRFWKSSSLHTVLQFPLEMSDVCEFAASFILTGRSTIQ